MHTATNPKKKWQVQLQENLRAKKKWPHTLSIRGCPGKPKKGRFRSLFANLGCSREFGVFFWKNKEHSPKPPKFANCSGFVNTPCFFSRQTHRIHENTPNSRTGLWIGLSLVWFAGATPESIPEQFTIGCTKFGRGGWYANLGKSCWSCHIYENKCCARCSLTQAHLHECEDGKPWQAYCQARVEEASCLLTSQDFSPAAFSPCWFGTSSFLLAQLQVLDGTKVQQLGVLPQTLVQQCWIGFVYRQSLVFAHILYFASSPENFCEYFFVFAWGFAIE